MEGLAERLGLLSLFGMAWSSSSALAREGLVRTGPVRSGAVAEPLALPGGTNESSTAGRAASTDGMRMSSSDTASEVGSSRLEAWVDSANNAWRGTVSAPI